MIELLMSPEMWASLLTLTILEIVLGIDNIIFLSIVSGRLPKAQQAMARRVGLLLAMFMRIGLLAAVAWLASLTAPFMTLFDHEISWRDIILAGGGLFLIYKGTDEIHDMMEENPKLEAAMKVHGFASAIVQIVILDIVFSLDSVITAVGIADHLPVMIAAIVIAIAIMMFAAEPVARFVDDHPSVKMLALSFLILVGMALVADGLHFHIPRGYLYFAVAFSLAVEVLNLIVAKKRGTNMRPVSQDRRQEE
ncbi:MAG: TerC family protein [Rhodospirillales bacterium]|nr:TerC family protein [Rhodospirillales bacterium]